MKISEKIAKLFPDIVSISVQVTESCRATKGFEQWAYTQNAEEELRFRLHSGKTAWKTSTFQADSPVIYFLRTGNQPTKEETYFNDAGDPINCRFEVSVKRLEQKKPDSN